MKTTGRRPLLLAAAVVFFVVGFLGWRALPAEDRHLNLLAAVAVMLVLAPLTTLLNGLEYVGVARLVGKHPPLPRALHIAVLGTAANLLPVPGAVLVRVDALRREGTSMRRSTAASACAAFLWGSAAAVLAGLALLTSHLLLGVLLVGGGVVFAAGGFETGRRVGRGTGQSPWRGVGWLMAVELGTVVVGALRLMVISAGIGQAIGFGQAAGLGLASIAAAAIGLFPGGLGLREALSAALAPILELPAAVGAVAATFDRLLGLPVVIIAALLLSRRDRHSSAGSTS